MKINQNDLETVARVLAVINPGRAHEAHIRDMINANIREGEWTYISICGWTAHSWMDENLETHVKVSLMPFSVEKYLKATKEALATLYAARTRLEMNNIAGEEDPFIQDCSTAINMLENP